jgi:hypothetical protein
MRLIDIISDPSDLFELKFMGSPCKTDCSGHKAGYKWSLDHGGITTSTPSSSFDNGTHIAAAQRSRRAQGGGKLPGYVSQTLAAKAKRAKRLAAKKAGQQPMTPPADKV